MDKELIDREQVLQAIILARTNAGRTYKGDRLKGVLSGLSIAYNLIERMEPIYTNEKESEENA